MHLLQIFAKIKIYNADKIWEAACNCSELFQTHSNDVLIFENISRFVPGETGGAPAIIFMLVERDSVDGSLGNGVDCAWMLLLRGCRSAGSIYLAFIQLHSIFIILHHIKK